MLKVSVSHSVIIRNCIIFFHLMCLLSTSSFAAFLPEIDVPIDEVVEEIKKLSDFRFLAPTETVPQMAKPILDRAPHGVYIAVGAERGFIDVSMASQADYLLLVDSNPAVIIYNKINIALLQVSINQKAYLALRYAQDHKTWLDFAGQMENYADDILFVLRSEECFKFWKWTQKTEKMRIFSESKDHPSHFKNSNYLIDEVLFERIRQLAADDNIQSIQVDFSQLDEVKNLVKHLVKDLRSPRLPLDPSMYLSVLDLSNAWEPGYLTLGQLKAVVNEFKPFATEQSILLLTESQKVLASGERFGRIDDWFGYIGASFSQFLKGAADVEAKFFSYLSMKLDLWREKGIPPVGYPDKMTDDTDAKFNLK